MVEVSEPIKVAVFFENNCFKPYLFFWNRRQIKVEKINLVHTSKDGFSIFYHFSISSGSNVYYLKFDTGKLRWFLEAVEEE